MESTDVGKMMNVVRKLKVRKPYSAPKLRRLGAELLKTLSQDGNSGDKELQQPTESVDRIFGAKGS